MARVDDGEGGEVMLYLVIYLVGAVVSSLAYGMLKDYKFVFEPIGWDTPFVACSLCWPIALPYLIGYITGKRLGYIIGDRLLKKGH